MSALAACETLLSVDESGDLWLVHCGVCSIGGMLGFGFDNAAYCVCFVARGCMGEPDGLRSVCEFCACVCCWFGVLRWGRSPFGNVVLFFVAIYVAKMHLNWT